MSIIRVIYWYITVNDGDVPIYHPDDIVAKDIDLVIIASVAFYDEIYNSIKGLPCAII